MTAFTRRIRTLHEAFPSSGVTIPEPGELGEIVQLVHQFLGPLVRHPEMRQESVVGVVDVLTVEHTVVPPDRVRYIPFCNVFHNDVGFSRILELTARYDNVALSSLIDSTVNRLGEVAGASFPAFRIFAANRAFLLSPGYRLRGQVSALSLGSRVDLQITFVDFLISEQTPTL